MVDTVILFAGLTTEEIRVKVRDNGDGTFSMAVNPYQLSSQLTVTTFEDTDVADLAIAVNAYLAASDEHLINIEFWGTVGMNHFCAVTEAAAP